MFAFLAGRRRVKAESAETLLASVEVAVVSSTRPRAETLWTRASDSPAVDADRMRDGRIEDGKGECVRAAAWGFVVEFGFCLDADGVSERGVRSGKRGDPGAMSLLRTAPVRPESGAADAKGCVAVSLADELVAASIGGKVEEDSRPTDVACRI